MTACAMALAGGLHVVAAAQRTTVAVLDFAQLETAHDPTAHRWLSKAFSDLLIGDLVIHPELRPVTREHMRMLMRESELREMSGLTEDRMDPEEYRRMQGYLKVDHMILGTFSIQDGQIDIHARIIERDAGKRLAGFSQSGALTNALQLEKNLARDMLEFYSGGNVAAADWELPVWTDSMPASEWLYRGVDAFDAGRYVEAWYHFRRATRLDPGYADALYWTGRMYHYRQDYAHAHIVYREFIRRYPKHGRVGDAVAEYVHSRECGALTSAPEGAHPDATDGFTPQQALELYRSLRARNWDFVFVHNKVDYASRSPLGDWLMKREQQALTYLGDLPGAFALIESGLKNLTDEPADATARSWRDESRQLMAMLAMESEDAGGPRLSSQFLHARDYRLLPDHPVAEEDLRAAGLKGNDYRWGTNWRILAPPGYTIKSVRTTIFRTNDPKVGAICRLQLRRYRYVDIDACWTEDTLPGADRKYERTIQMPPGCTWFYLRPEYDGRRGAHQASFDGWRLEAELLPIARDVGGVRVEVDNAFEFNTTIDGVYTRCYDGAIPNLPPGKYTVSIAPVWGRRTWAFAPMEHVIEIPSNRFLNLTLNLSLNADVRDTGWNNPCAVATHYPTYKHRPRPDSNWRSGSPAIAVHPDTGHYLAVWAHLDDLWYARSKDGIAWDTPEPLPPPVNSADAEINPRLLIDNQGRYCLLFLSNRGLSRNLATYIAWSRNLTHWSRPVMLTPHHHDDHDLIQDDQGRYLALLTPSDKTPDGGNDQNAMITLLASRDLDEWTNPVPREAWHRLFYPYELPEEAQVQYQQQERPHKARIVQDRHGTYHLVWISRTTGRLQHARSSDLAAWSRLAQIPHILQLKPFNLAITTTDDRLLAAVIAADGMYSGHEVFAMSAIPLNSDTPALNWYPMAIPPLIVNGMPELVYHAGRKQVSLGWQVAEQELHPTRLSGPVYIMTGNPVPLSVDPPAFRAIHAETAQRLDAAIARLQAQGRLTAAEQADVGNTWSTYYAELLKTILAKGQNVRVNQMGAVENHNYAAYYLNCWRMAVLDPRNHGGWPTRNFLVKQVYSVLRNSLVDDSIPPPWLAAVVFPALFNDCLPEAVQAYRRLETADPFWAAQVRSRVQTFVASPSGPYAGDPVSLGAANAFLLEIASK